MRACFTVVAAAALAAGLAVHAQEPRPGARPRPRPRDRDIDLLVRDAAIAPPEFSADALLRIASFPKVDSDWRREMLDDAYMRAYVAQEPYRRITGATPADTRQGADARASETGLTRVSLQLRVVQAMASEDPAHARELFEWIDLDLEPGACDSALAPAVDEYYTVLSVLARTTFPSDGAGRGEALRFFELFLWRAHLPTEMPAVARALQRFHPTRDEAAYLDTVFRSILDGGLRDPRGFSVASIDIVSKLGELEDADRQLGLTGWYTLRALRQYLVTQLTGPRCGDSLSDGPAVDTFNIGLKRRDAIADGVAPLATADTRPSRMLGIARIDPYWQTPDARRLFDQGVRLRGTARNPVSDTIRRTAAWRSQAEHLLVDLEQWGGTREASERDYFYQKSLLFTLLIDLTPPSDVRVRVLRAYADFLRRADLDRVRRALWFAFASRLIELTHSEDRRLVLDLLEDSHHPVLSLYGRLERILASSNRRIE